MSKTKCACKTTLEKALDDIEKILQEYFTRQDTISYVNKSLILMQDLKHTIQQHIKDGDTPKSSIAEQ